MTKFNLDTTKVKSIVYDEHAMDVYLTDEGELVFNSNINGEVIDSNFNELDARLTEVESQIRLRVMGTLNRLQSIIDDNTKLGNNE